MYPTEWRVIAASVTGFDHQADKKLCQDAYAYKTPSAGWLVAAVSDGAGSAPHGGLGAKTFCEGVVSNLASWLAQQECPHAKPVSDMNVRPVLESAIESCRAKLRALDEGDCGGLCQFHATLLGVIAGPRGGVFFHIGDGAGLATKFQDTSNNVVSKPENGEYANETYFASQENWREHLRLLHFGSEYDLIALMTDGVTPFAMTQGAGAPFHGFFEPLNNYLAIKPSEDAARAIRACMEDDRIRWITGDDKTLIWALRCEQVSDETDPEASVHTQ